MQVRYVVTVFACVGAFAALAAAGPPVCELQKLTASDGDSLDGYGFSVAVDGDLAVSGAWVDEVQGLLSGSAYFLRRVNGEWVEEQKVLASDGNAWARFGHAVAIHGDVAVIGAVADDDECPGEEFCFSGSAYVFRRVDGVWIEEQKLTASDAAPQQEFGFTAAVGEGFVAIGAICDSNGCGGSSGCCAGAVYVYRYDGTWIEEQKLTVPEGELFDKFGNAVAISGDTILIGMQWDDDLGSNAGAAYIFDYNGSEWIASQKLHASDAVASADFGFSVSIAGDVVLIGAHWDDDPCPGDPLCRSGAAYVFRYDGELWNEEQKLTPSDGQMQDEFGHSVAIEGDLAVVGARLEDEICPEDPDCDSGAAYVYRLGGGARNVGWTEVQKVMASDLEDGDFFGISVSVSGDEIFIGSYLDDDLGTASGAAYVFGVDDACPQFADCDADGDVDTHDFATFQTCFTGAGTPWVGDCECSDFDGDSDVDLRDYSEFQSALTGPR